MKSDPNKSNLLICALLVTASVLLSGLLAKTGWENRLLTMQIPILIGCFLLPMSRAVICAVLAPVLCCAIFGVPELYPALPVTVSQTIALAAGGNMFYVVMDKKISLSLLFAEAAGLTLMFCAISILSWISDDVDAFSYASAIIADGWPGVLLQFLTVPPVILVIQKRKAK
jgi:hypothetical protein